MTPPALVSPVLVRRWSVEMSVHIATASHVTRRNPVRGIRTPLFRALFLASKMG
jgi:hypothetical protein